MAGTPTTRITFNADQADADQLARIAAASGPNVSLSSVVGVLVHLALDGRGGAWHEQAQILLNSQPRGRRHHR
jgi:hypothetical protein